MSETPEDKIDRLAVEVVEKDKEIAALKLKLARAIQTSTVRDINAHGHIEEAEKQVKELRELRGKGKIFLTIIGLLALALIVQTLVINMPNIAVEVLELEKNIKE